MALHDGIFSYVYFVQAPSNGLIKIGRTDREPAKRLASLRAASPVSLVPLGIIWGSRTYEGRLHDRFADLHDHAEWFKPGRKLMAFIERWTHPWDAIEQLTWDEPGRARTIDEILAERRALLFRHVEPAHPLRIWSPRESRRGELVWWT